MEHETGARGRAGIRRPAPELLGSVDAARLLGCSPRHVARLCQDGHLAASKEGDVWAIRPEEIARFRRRAPGRPRDARPTARALRRRVQRAERRACAS